MLQVVSRNSNVQLTSCTYNIYVYTSKQQVSRKRPTFPNHRDKTIRKQGWKDECLVFSTFRFENCENPEKREQRASQPFLLNFYETTIQARVHRIVKKFSFCFFRCRNKVWWFANWRRSWGCGWGGRASRCSNKWKFCTTRTSIWRERSPYFATRSGWVSLFPSFASRMEKKEETKEGRETSGSAIFLTRIFCIPPKGERYQSFSLQLPRLSRRDVIKKKKGMKYTGSIFNSAVSAIRET